MAKKKPNKTAPPALVLQPHHSTDPLASPASSTSPATFLSNLQAALSSIQHGRIFQLDLGSAQPQLSTASATPSSSEPLSSPLPRYSLTIVDYEPPTSPPLTSSPLRCGVLILQQGRELESLFSQPEGQLSLCKQHAFQRLVLVALNRGHRFASLDAVQAELRPHIPSLLPSSTPPSSVPFLALSSELGDRRSVASLLSPHNGLVLVEDLLLSGHWTRRLLFARTGCVQSEARLLRPPVEGGGAAAIDFAWLACQYQQAFVAALALLPRPPRSFLLVGLGAGSLPMFLARCFPLASIQVVELDPEVVRLATEHFGFETSGRLTLTIGDGLEFVAGVERAAYDVVCVDCNSAEVEEGLSFPPPAFVTRQRLRAMRDATTEEGAWLLNFGCRRADRRREVLEQVVGVWVEEGGERLYEVDVDEEDVNTVLVGRRGGEETSEVTRAQCRARVLTGVRVEEQRRQAKEAGVEAGDFRWSEDLQLRSRVDDIHVVTKEQDPNNGGQWQFSRSALPEGAEEEEDGEEDGNSGDAAADGTAGLSAEDRKRARARAKRAKQKQRKR